MSFDLDRIKWIADRHKSTVFGYLRESFDDDITDLICYICLLFYAPIPTFSKWSTYFSVSDDNTLKSNGTSDLYDYGSAFGRQWYNSMDANVITWKVEISIEGEFNDEWFLIGIVSNYHNQEVDRYAGAKHSHLFYPCHTGKIKVNDKDTKPIDELDRRVESGDTINLTLNLTSKSLSYYLNNDKNDKYDTKFLTNSIKTAEDIKYRFVLTMGASQVKSAITVTEFATKSMI